MDQLSLFPNFNLGDEVSFCDLGWPCSFSDIRVGDFFVHYHWRSDHLIVLRCDQIIILDGHLRLVCNDGSSSLALIDDIRGYIPDHFYFLRE